MNTNEENFDEQVARDESQRFERPRRPRQRITRQRGERVTSYQPHQQGDYQPRANYQPRQQGPYQPRANYQHRQQGDYQPRTDYQPRQQGPYQPRANYQPRQQGEYQPRNKAPYNHPRQQGYNPQQRQQGYNPQQRQARQARFNSKRRIDYKETNIDPNEPIRLNKYLSNAGVCSRREADTFIQAGVVQVNGKVVTELGTKVMRSDHVMFHDQPVRMEKKVYVLLNKPKNYVTTVDDPQNRKTVMELVKNACSERIYPVGRLDRNTTGVLLLTNDGELTTKLTHPQYLKKKVYHVFLDKNISAADMQRLVDGIELDDGMFHADAIEYASPTDKKQVGIEIHSGKNRIVRRLFEALGYYVTKLDRVQFCGLTKKNVRRGDWRFLTEREVDMLRMGAFE